MPLPKNQNPDRRPLFDGSGSGRLVVLLGILLVLAAWKLSARVMGYDFLALGDDDINVTLNPHLGMLDRDRWVWLFTDWSYVRRFMPFGWMTLCAIFHLNGLDPTSYHSAALAFYAANTGLVLVLAVHAIRVFVPGAARGLTAWQGFAAFLAAGWWAFHPLRVESTAWISGLLYGQGATLFLLALIAYLRSYLALERGTRRLPWLALSLAAVTASLMTYPIALGFPVLVLAMDVLFIRGRSGPAVPSLGRLACEKLLFLAPGAAIAMMTLLARLRNPAIWGHAPTFAEFPLAERVMQGFYIVAYYVWRPLSPLRLPPITSALLGFDPWSSIFLLSAGLVVAITAAVFFWRRAHPWAATLWIGYLAMVVPFVGFTEHPYYASDRYAYLPTIVMAAALAVGLACIRRGPGRFAASAAALGLTALLALTTDRSLGIWAGPGTMYGYLVDSLPEGEQHDRIQSRFAMFDYLYGKPDEARRKIDRCVRDFPASEEILKVKAAIEDPAGRLAPVGERLPIAFMHYQMGLYFLQLHQPAEAAVQLTRALGFDPLLFQADYDLAVLDGTSGLPREALHHCLLAEDHGGNRLSPAKVTSCLQLIENAARASGDAGLAASIEARLRRGPLPK
jgi:hypothetical protein